VRSRHAIYACLVLALWNARQPIPDAVQYDALTSAVELRRVRAEPSDMQKPLKGLWVWRSARLRSRFGSGQHRGSLYSLVAGGFDFEKGPETIARSPGPLRALKRKRSWILISGPSNEGPAGSSNHRGPRRSVYPLHTLASRQARGGLPTLA
jgi:hypothetical protein